MKTKNLGNENTDFTCTQNGQFLQIYDRIFAIADKNMREYGMEFSYSLPVFRSIIHVPPDVVDASEFDELSGDDLTAAVYVRCLGRMPDKAAWEAAHKLERTVSGRSDEARKIMLLSIAHSAEFACTGRCFIGLEEPGEKKRRGHVIRQMVQRAEGVIFIKMVIPVWKILPNQVKNLVRVCTGREKKS